ncbi:MAG: HAD family phosphatase [Anaerolineales bacterium]
MIKAIYFDLGGVIVRTEDKEPRAQLGAQFGLTYQQIEEVAFGGGPYGTGARASVGAVTEESHWVNVVRTLGLSPNDFSRIRADFFAGDKIDWDIVAFLREARKTHKVGLISNAWDGLRAWIHEQKFDDAFDHLTISAEVRMAKPTPGIYHHALGALGAKADEAIFVDDFIENIQAATALGMKAIHFRSAEQALSDVKKLIQT